MHHLNTHTPFLFLCLRDAPLGVSSISPLCCPQQEVATDLPAALFLFGFENRVFQWPCRQIWNRNCPFISLEACRKVAREGSKLSPSVSPLCSLFSSECISSCASPMHRSLNHLNISKWQNLLVRVHSPRLTKRAVMRETARRPVVILEELQWSSA